MTLPNSELSASTVPTGRGPSENGACHMLIVKWFVVLTTASFRFLSGTTSFESIREEMVSAVALLIEDLPEVVHSTRRPKREANVFS